MSIRNGKFSRTNLTETSAAARRTGPTGGQTDRNPFGDPTLGADMTTLQGQMSESAQCVSDMDAMQDSRGGCGDDCATGG